MGVDIAGSQWFWHYSYDGSEGSDSYSLSTGELDMGGERALRVNYPLLIPAGALVSYSFTSNDVIHSWASMGVKMDAIPGVVNSIWLVIDTLGVFFGGCSEFCGVGHRFMPISVEVVPRVCFYMWLKERADHLICDSLDGWLGLSCY